MYVIYIYIYLHTIMFNDVILIHVMNDLWVPSLFWETQRGLVQVRPHWTWAPGRVGRRANLVQLEGGVAMVASYGFLTNTASHNFHVDIDMLSHDKAPAHMI